MKGIKTSNILKILAIVLVVGILVTQKDALRNQMSVFGGKNGITTDPPKTERVAVVEIVYPRLPGKSLDPCTTETNNSGKKITHALIEKGTQLCEMSEVQINSLVRNTGYEKETLCECITNFCGINVQPDEFVKCLNKPEKL